MQRRFQIVDVFADTPFAGNPVAVVLEGEGLSTDQMLRITRWMNLSETTFLLPPTSRDADYRVRIFTLEREMPFAGHPTLGSCRAWLADDSSRSRQTVTQECGIGLVPIALEREHLAFAAPPLLRDGPASDAETAAVCEFLGLQRNDIVDCAWVDNGPGWIGVLMRSADEVLAVNAPGSYAAHIDVGLIGPYPAGTPAQFEVRALFSDQHGAIREDPVTGSLNASMAQWMLKSNRASAPFVNHQGQRVGRQGRIRIDQDEDGTVWVAGSANVLVRGTLTA